MKKDNTAFRERFQRWKNGELVYENGRVIPHYEVGSDGDIIDGGNLGEVVVRPDRALRLQILEVFPNTEVRKGVLNQLYKWKLVSEMGKPMYHGGGVTRIIPNNTEELPADYEVRRLLNIVNDSNRPTTYINPLPFAKVNVTKRSSYSPERNTILMPTDLKSVDRGRDYISELAHAILYNTDLYTKGRRTNSSDAAYNDPTNVEYLAHKVIEPAIYQYLRSQDSSNFRNTIPHYEGGSDGFFDKIINTVHNAYNINNNEQYAPEGQYRLYDVAKKNWELNNPFSFYTFDQAMAIERMMDNVVPRNELIGPAPNISEYERNLNNLRGLAAAAYEQKLKDIQTGMQVLGALGTIARPSTWIAAPFRGVEHFGEGFGNELVDIPLDIATAPAAKLAFKGIKSASKALTPVRNIPYNSENFYRSVGKEAIEDANTTGVVRANPTSEYAGPNFLLGSVPLFTRGRNYVIEAPKGSADTWVDAKAYERGLGNYGKPTIAEASAENPIAYPITNGELSIPTDQASYWKKYPILGWRLKLFKTPTLEQEVFPEGLLNDRPLIASGTNRSGFLSNLMDEHFLKINSLLNQPYQIERYPGFMLRPLMEGNPLEKLLSKAGTISVNSIKAQAAKSNSMEKSVIDEVLASEQFAGQKSIDYNAFRKAVLDKLITYKRIPNKRYDDYGIDRLGLDKQKTYLNTYTFESPQIINGSGKHYGPNTLGHSRTYTTKEDPDILHVMESQSDWGLSGREKQLLDISEFERRKRLISEDIEDLNKEYESIQKELYGSGLTDEEFLKINGRREHTRDIINKRSNYLSMLIDEGYSTPQSRYLSDNYTTRLILENLKYAAEHGQTKMRYPTPETAAKIEGYTKSNTEWIDNPEFEPIKRKIKQIEEEMDAGDPWTKAKLNPLDVEDLDLVKKLNEALEQYFDSEYFLNLLSEYNKTRNTSIPAKIIRRTYSPEHKTILKKYSDFPKQFKKLWKDLEVRTVTDKKGNSWYEVDVPKNFLKREWIYSVAPWIVGGGLTIPTITNDKR